MSSQIVTELPLQTERLSIRDFNENDSESLFQLYRIPETSQFESWSIVDDETEATEILQFWTKEQGADPRKGYTLAVELKESATFIGLIGLDRGFSVETDNSRVGFVGFRYFPVHWNKGYATEALSAILSWGFESLGLQRIHSGCMVENAASARVLEKAGMRHEGTTRQSFPIDDVWYDYHIYGILRTDTAPGQDSA